MERTPEANAEVLDLGDVADTTKGSWGHYADDVLMQEMAGLKDD